MPLASQKAKALMPPFKWQLLLPPSRQPSQGGGPAFRIAQRSIASFAITKPQQIDAGAPIVTNNRPNLYPLRFKEILRDYNFGNRWIARAFEKAGLPEKHPLTETWEVVDRPGESGEIINGDLRGMTLRDAIAAYGEELLGSDIVARHGARFPLLIKFLDASGSLNAQMHPNDEWAAAKGGFDTGKTEAWYMIKTRPDASVHIGNKPGVTRDLLYDALLDETTPSHMKEYEIQPRDSFLIYPGTMHYSHGGALFCEIMQNSDITFGFESVCEGGTPRPERARELAGLIHLEDEYEARTSHITVGNGDNKHTYLLACRHFAMERLDLVTSQSLDLDGCRFHVVSQIEGTSRLVCEDRVEVLRPGGTCLLPASLHRARVEPEGQASLLLMYVPDLVSNIVRPLLARGIEHEAILGLGGKTRRNDLQGLVP
jgi:mannose-6-phosphate isomerase